MADRNIKTDNGKKAAKDKKPKRPGSIGRKEKLFDKWTLLQLCNRLEYFAQYGLTNEQMAGMLGVGHNTLNDYRNKYPEIQAAILKGKESANLKVKESVFKRAQGYEFTEQKLDRLGNLVTITTHVPPETKASEFWLTNRDPENWKKRQSVELKGSLLTADMTDQDLNEAITKLITKTTS